MMESKMMGSKFMMTVCRCDVAVTGLGPSARNQEWELFP